MRFDKMFRAMGPFVAMAAMGGMMAAKRRSGGRFDMNFGPCEGGRFRFNGKEGVSLDELDMSGEAPREVVLMSGDNVTISAGDDFAITLQGTEDARAAARFVLEDGVLFILRDGAEGWQRGDGVTIDLTMPAPEKVTIAGSGEVTVHALAAEAQVVIAGSGNLKAAGLALRQLDISIAGSGNVHVGGSVERLELSIAGSGTADMAGLKADEAEIDIAGSGNAVFASDGEVGANIMGSGCVTVRGSARCRVHTMGSGSLVCERGEEASPSAGKPGKNSRKAA